MTFSSLSFEDLIEGMCNDPQFIAQCDYDGIDFVDVDTENVSFVKYHDLADYGVLACDCSTYIAR